MSLEDTSTSVSKGCFAYKGTLRRANEKNYLPMQKDKFVEDRLELFREVWEELHVQIDLLRSNLNSKIFEDLIGFASQCHRNREGDQVVSVDLGEIPTAVLITGVNTPDHDVMFSNLDQMLKSKVTPLVARIFTKDCSKISTLICSLISQLTNIAGLQENEEDGDASFGQTDKSTGESPIKLKAPIRHHRSITMSTLVKWYKREYPDEKHGGASPRKKSKPETTRNEKPLIIVMLEDAENIKPSVLQDFITLCSSHLNSLPLVLVMGIATAVTAIHQLLPSSVSSLLCMEKYQAPPASHYLTQLLDRIVMAPELPFKLGPKVFHFLLDIFLYHDFSIVNFTMGFQRCMLEHYLENPLSLLCCMQDDIDKMTATLTHAQLEDIRRQPAFMRHVEIQLAGPAQAKLLTDDAFTRHHLAAVLHGLHAYHARMFGGLHFLYHLAKKLPKHPLGKQFREIYSTCLTAGHVCDSEGYKEAIALLKMMSLDELCSVLEGGLAVLRDREVKSEEIGSLISDVNGFLHRLKHIDEELDEEEDQATPGEDNSATRRVLPQRAKLHELKATLQAMSHRRRRSPYERLREEIFDCLHSHFLSLLESPSKHSLHEIVYFNDLPSVRDQLQAAPRLSVQHALMHPGKYLGCACCECEDAGSISASMPDVCVVYKLHLECGTLVNLYDWLQAFVTVVTAGEVDDSGKVESSSKKKGKKGGVKTSPGSASSRSPSTELRARFIRAVAELQFLGFIKSTRRKTDHVTRLTW